MHAKMKAPVGTRLDRVDVAIAKAGIVKRHYAHGAMVAIADAALKVRDSTEAWLRRLRESAHVGRAHTSRSCERGRDVTARHWTSEKLGHMKHPPAPWPIIERRRVAGLPL